MNAGQGTSRNVIHRHEFKTEMVGTIVGAVAELWRYPVKSVRGEELAEAHAGALGLAGDRAYAFLDVETNRVVSAKNPKRWPGMFRLRASYASSPLPGRELPPVRIEFPDGAVVESSDPDAARRISEFLGRDVRLVVATEDRFAVEVYTPPLLGLEEGFGEFRLPAGRFHDSTPLHLVTTATLSRLQDLYPKGRFEARRFRPNLLIDTGGTRLGFIEQSWIGRTLEIGGLRMNVQRPCSRCIMTTLPQGDLADDRGILQTVLAEADGDVGVKGPVAQGGVVRRGDSVRLA